MSTNNQDELDKNKNYQIINNISPELINEKRKNLDIYIMEKDKEIINLCVLNKSLISQIEELKREKKEQDLQIASLKTDLNTLETDKNILIKDNEKLKEKINNLNNIITSKENQINEISKKNDEIIKEINNAYIFEIKNYEDNLKNNKNI